MGNTPSVTGPDRGRSHVIRHDNSFDSSRGQRPVRSRIEERDAQLAEEISDEETNRKSSSLSVPESHHSYKIQMLYDLCQQHNPKGRNSRLKAERE